MGKRDVRAPDLGSVHDQAVLPWEVRQTTCNLPCMAMNHERTDCPGQAQAVLADFTWAQGALLRVSCWSTKVEHLLPFGRCSKVWNFTGVAEAF